MLYTLLGILDFLNARKQQRIRLYQMLGVGAILIILGLGSIHIYGYLSQFYDPTLVLASLIGAWGLLGLLSFWMIHNFKRKSVFSNSIRDLALSPSDHLSWEQLSRFFQDNKKYIPTLIAFICLISVYRTLVRKK